MRRATHIRTKLGFALAVPLAGLVIVSGVEVRSSMQDLGATRQQIELATISVGPGSLITRLQDERNRAAIDLIGLGAGASQETKQARDHVDAAAAELREVARRRGTHAFDEALGEVSLLPQLRADIDASTHARDLANRAEAEAVFRRYTEIIGSFFDAAASVAVTVDDAGLRNGVDIVDSAARSTEARAEIVRWVVLSSANDTSAASVARQEVAALRERVQTLDERIRLSAVGPYAGIADATFEEPAVQRFNAQTDAFLAGRPAVVADMVSAVRPDPAVGYLGLRGRAVDALAREALRVENDAISHQRLFGALALGLIGLAVLVTWVASRSITRPLASLRTQAEEMAATRLPGAVRQILDTPAGEDVVIPEIDPIAVRSRDEVAEVAATLNSVQASALDLAVEQAVLRRNISDSFINLGRRNQNLLSRQLDFITELERNETDPDTLEGLFRLDHLATRMRRNAESLLVLAGIDPPRQWSAPVKLSDVVRAALGEVEDYQRVVIRHLEPAALTGAVAADIAHLSAELIENALSFSPAEQQVEVKGRLTTAGYTLAISDNGFGMTAEELARANRRLAGSESFAVAPSRYLGHYVAGHLASALGVVVELQDSPAGGVTARIDVPMGLLADEETDPRLAGLAAQDTAPRSPEPAPDPGPVSDPVSPEPASDPAPVATLEQPAAPPAAPSVTPGGLVRRGERNPEPAAPTPASGFGGLAIAPQSGPSLFTVVAQNARESASQDGDTTRTGLTRRVRGAQRPDATTAPRHLPKPAGDAAATRSSAEDVYSFLSSFQSGVERGRAGDHDELGSTEDDE
ncbi:MAG: nitrate- and nitrite sensing domain-containing protein [Microthrixaceae bacterium]